MGTPASLVTHAEGLSTSSCRNGAIQAFICHFLLVVCGNYVSVLYCFWEVTDFHRATDDDFFHRINTNSNHVLQPYLPDNNKLPYQLRTRHHNTSLIIKTNFLNDTDFIVRMLYKYSYWRSYWGRYIPHLSPQLGRICCHLLPSFAICIVLFFLPRIQFYLCYMLCFNVLFRLRLLTF